MAGGAGEDVARAAFGTERPLGGFAKPYGQDEPVIDKRYKGVDMNKTGGQDVKQDEPKIGQEERAGRKKRARPGVPLARWRELFDLAAEIKALAPWERYADAELFAVEPPGTKERLYFGFIGMFGTCFGVCGYVGANGLRDHYRICEIGEAADASAVAWAMLEQNALTCYFGDRETVAPSQIAVIRELGLKFRGRGAWTNFVASRTGMYPADPDAEGVETLIQGYRMLVPLLRHALSGGFGREIDFSKEQPLVSLDAATGTPMFSLVEPPAIKTAYPGLMCSSEKLLAAMAASPQTSLTVLVDMNYLPDMPVAEPGEPLSLPLLFTVMDADSEQLFLTRMVRPGDDRNDACMRGLIEFILQCGRPALITVRKNVVEALVADLCKRLDIEMEYDEEVFDAMDKAVAFLGGRG